MKQCDKQGFKKQSVTTKNGHDKTVSAQSDTDDRCFYVKEQIAVNSQHITTEIAKGFTRPRQIFKTLVISAGTF